LIENSTALSLDDAYLELWRILLEARCRVLEAVPPYALAAAQGVWWALWPQAMAKRIHFRLAPTESGTRVVSETYWSPLLVAGLTTAYVACYFLLGFAALHLLAYGMGSLLRSTYGLLLLVLAAIVSFLIVFHAYSYAARGVTARRILTSLNLSGTPLLADRTRHRLEYLREKER